MGASPDVHPEDTLCEMGHITEKERIAIHTVNQLHRSILKYTTALLEDLKTKVHSELISLWMHVWYEAK